jgi:Ricin-type beta-trefoil lectin domain-like
VLVAIAVVIAFGVLGAGQASAGVDTSHIYRITTLLSGLALDVQGGSFADEAPVIQWGVNGGQNQEWKFVDAGSGWYEIVNYNSGKCLTIQGNTRAAGAKLVQYGCGFADNQLWRLVASSGQAASLQSKLSRLYADVPGGSGVWGTQLIQWYAGVPQLMGI